MTTLTSFEPVEIFISYSHKDGKLRDQLEKHLSALKQQQVITSWYDRKIEPGADWSQEIDTHLNSAKVILLLVSADFIASDYCYGIEMRRALERHEKGEVTVIPVILRPVDWESASFGKLQALPTNAIPVTKWANRDEAFTSVAKGIRRVVEKLTGKALLPEADELTQSVQKFGGAPTRTQEQREAATDIRTSSPARIAQILRQNKTWFVIAVVLLATVLGLVWWRTGRTGNPGTETANHPAIEVKAEIIVTGRPPGSAKAGVVPDEGLYVAEQSFPVSAPPAGKAYATTGVTIWRARSVTPRDGEDVARETIDTQELAFERIEDNLKVGDRVYMSIEYLPGASLPGKSAFLYVINREQYADGTLGPASLIFPTLRTYGGDNRVEPGRPRVLPGTDRPFLIRRSTARGDHVGEIYTIIVAPQKLDKNLPRPIGETHMMLPPDLVARWERDWSGPVYRATLRDGMGRARTKREQAFGSRSTVDTAEPLTLQDSLPQTCLRTLVTPGNPAIMIVKLRFRE